MKIEIKENIEINVPDNSEGQIVLKLKTVFGGKGQIQITAEIETEINEVPKPKRCTLFHWDMRKLLH